MWGFSMCNGCPFVNRGEGGTCNCINPMADWNGLLTARYLVSYGPEDDARMAKIKEERYQDYIRNLERLYPSEAERLVFQEKPHEELGGLSIMGMRDNMPYGIEVAEDVLAYLAGKREGGSDWERRFSNAVGGYYFREEREKWLDSSNELLGGDSNRNIAQGGGYKVLTEVLWFLLLANPAGKETPMFMQSRTMSPLEEEMLLDEYFPESAGQAYYSNLAAQEARAKGRMFLLIAGLAVLGITGYALYCRLFG